MSNNMKRIDIGNYRGDLHVKKIDGKYYWAVECDFTDVSVWQWEEITQSLYRELITYQELAGD